MISQAVTLGHFAGCPSNLLYFVIIRRGFPIRCGIRLPHVLWTCCKCGNERNVRTRKIISGAESAEQTPMEVQGTSVEGAKFGTLGHSTVLLATRNSSTAA